MKPTIAALALMFAAPAATAPPAKTILFVGNSFTEGAHSAVKRFGAATVTDLNGEGHGGVPALFKRFAEQAGLDYVVSLETQGGQTLGFHRTQRRARIDRAWDVVVLQDLSVLDRKRPGDATHHIRDSALLATMFTRANRNVRVEIMATWSRADQVYKPGNPWSGTPLPKMAIDLQAASHCADAASVDIDGVIPVGEAWNRAFETGVADPNPYDGISFGQVNLWAYDHYHGSIHGYYLEALVVFGKLTGLDPRSLGSKETAAADLGISSEQTVQLQQVAAEQLAALTKPMHAPSSPQRLCPT